MAKGIPERTASMARAYVEQGLTYAQIAEEFGITRQRVGQLLGPLNLARDVNARKATRVQKLRASHERVTTGTSTLEEEAARLGYKSGHILRHAFWSLGLKVVLHPLADPPHGTYARYSSNRFSCRCADCRRANRERVAKLKESEAPNHGTYSGYVNYACRCQECKEAYRTVVRARRVAKRREQEVEA